MNLGHAFVTFARFWLVNFDYEIVMCFFTGFFLCKFIGL